VTEPLSDAHISSLLKVSELESRFALYILNMRNVYVVKLKDGSEQAWLAIWLYTDNTGKSVLS
jgi:hypothetical protein